MRQFESQATILRHYKAAILPRKGAKIWQHGNTKAERHNRDENLRRIRKVRRKACKLDSYEVEA
jgi:hypothetical protein